VQFSLLGLPTKLLELLRHPLEMFCTPVTPRCRLRTFRVASTGDLRCNRRVIDGVVKAVVADRHATVLPHSILLQHLLDLRLDGLAAMQPAPAYHPRNLFQLSGRGGQQGVPLGCSTIGQVQIAAGDQPLAGKVRMREFKQVALVE
jgi:hypothetical protein